jgi:hypothetical protein
MAAMCARSLVAMSIVGRCLRRCRASTQGIYVFGDWRSGRIWGLNTDRNAPGKPAQVRQLLDTDVSLSACGEEDVGEIYVLDLRSGVAYR